MQCLYRALYKTFCSLLEASGASDGMGVVKKECHAEQNANHMLLEHLLDALTYDANAFGEVARAKR